ncbi:hypothetical protein [Nocardioides sp.]|uniref:hypothetical protein n=1 Tax=Nocardioides sp. TaxID=35761 RepID=UPI003516D3B1
MKKFSRKASLALVALVATVGAIGVSVPTDAHADTGWGWRVAPGTTSSTSQ